MRRVFLLSFITTICLNLLAQNDTFDSFRAKSQDGFSEVRSQMLKDYEDFRQQANANYIQFMRQAWHDYNQIKGIDVPTGKEKPIPPVILPVNTPNPTPIDSKPIPVIDIKKVNIAVRQPQPKPISPVRVKPILQETYHSFVFLGTKVQVRVPEKNAIQLTCVDENAVADAWEALCKNGYDCMLYDCLELRKHMQLCDWAYLLLLDDLASTYCQSHDERCLLLAWLYCQSGYMMRLAVTEKNQLEVLFASRFDIYRCSYYDIQGTKFYLLSSYQGKVRVFDKCFENEQALSLIIEKDLKVANAVAESRTLTSERYPDMTVTVHVNKNLISFYNTYPTSEIGDYFMTRWALYAETPMSEGIKNELYPALARTLRGKSELEQANRLLNWVQTAFAYEYDDKVWGGDRAFFAEETLYYPYCDCEDRSILFSRLVRDLLGLDVLLIYYPGHMATAVKFAEPVNGDYIEYKGERYVIADPTYINAPVGYTMPNHDNNSTKVILL